MTYDLSAVGGEAFYDTDKNTVNIFQKTYNDYLEQIKGIRLDSIAHKLGARCEKNILTITFFNAEYTVSVDKISDSAGKKPALDTGYRPSLSANYDFVVQFDALPMIPIILLFNNADEEFPATCSILFESQAEKYLDCECLAMLGRQLVNHLKLPLNDNTAIP